jgi:hypothetical protein
VLHKSPQYNQQDPIPGSGRAYDGQAWRNSQSYDD